MTDPAWRAGSRLRLGVPRTHYFSNLDPEVAAALDEALNVFKKMGARVQDVPLEVSKDRMVIRAEAYAYHSPRIVATPMLYKPETLAKLRSGETITAETYIAARRDLERLRRDSPKIFSTVDVLVTPTTPVPAPKAADLPSTIDAIVRRRGFAAAEHPLVRHQRPAIHFGALRNDARRPAARLATQRCTVGRGTPAQRGARIRARHPVASPSRRLI